MRGFRPSRFSIFEEDEDLHRDKEIKVELYTARAQAGLPLFEEPFGGELSRMPEHFASRSGR